MSEENNIVITNPKIIDFFNNNKVLSCENFLLYYIDVFLSKNKLTDDTVKLNIDEINKIYDEYKIILSCKKNFEMMNKEIKQICYKIKSPTLENACAKLIGVKRELHFCENCGLSFSKTKGLMTHKRKCDREHKEKKENEKVEEHEDNSDDETSEDNENL